MCVCVYTRTLAFLWTINLLAKHVCACLTVAFPPPPLSPTPYPPLLPACAHTSLLMLPSKALVLVMSTISWHSCKHGNSTDAVQVVIDSIKYATNIDKYGHPQCSAWSTCIQECTCRLIIIAIKKAPFPVRLISSWWFFYFLMCETSVIIPVVCVKCVHVYASWGQSDEHKKLF